jgi:DNA polymerase-3 subunit alpha
VHSSDADRGQLENLRDIFRRHQGSCRTRLHIVIPQQCTAVIRLPDSCQVAPSEALSMEVKGLLGYNAVIFE